MCSYMYVYIYISIYTYTRVVISVYTLFLQCDGIGNRRNTGGERETTRKTNKLQIVGARARAKGRHIGMR